MWDNTFQQRSENNFFGKAFRSTSFLKKKKYNKNGNFFLHKAKEDGTWNYPFCSRVAYVNKQSVQEKNKQWRSQKYIKIKEYWILKGVKKVKCTSNIKSYL